MYAEYQGEGFMAMKRSYNKDDDKLILDNWWDKSRRHEICRQLNRSVGTLNFRYYWLLKKKGQDPRSYRLRMKLGLNDNSKSQPVESNSQLTKPDGEIRYVYPDELDKNVTTLKQEVDRLRKEIDNQQKTFIAWADNMAYLARSNRSAVSMRSLIAENAKLAAEAEEAKKQADDAREKLLEEKERYEKVYHELNFWLGQFFKLSSIEKIATLEDFVPRLKAIVDKYGTVLTVTSRNATAAMMDMAKSN